MQVITTIRASDLDKTVKIMFLPCATLSLLSRPTRKILFDICGGKF